MIEHINFVEAIDFFKEALRVLKPGGVLRTVCPFMETIIESVMEESLYDEKGQEYVRTSLERACGEEIKVMNELGLNGIKDYPDAFQLVAMYMRYQHKFIWSYKLMGNVLLSIGFKNVVSWLGGEGIKSEYCIERRRRGLYHGNEWEKELNQDESYDIEGGAVEAIK